MESFMVVRTIQGVGIQLIIGNDNFTMRCIRKYCNSMATLKYLHVNSNKRVDKMLHNKPMQLKFLLAHKFAFANCAPTLRDKNSADRNRYVQ